MTFLFDIGNVLLAFDFIPALESLKGPNPQPDAINKVISAKDDFEAGLTPLPDYINFIRTTLDIQESDEHIHNVWNSIFTEIPQTFELAQSLKAQGHRLILFSNINPIHAPYCINKYNLNERFDHAVFSYEIGAIKPQSEFFTRAFKKFNIIPEETIYIDDLPENIASGIKHGLKSFCYNATNHQKLLDWIKINMP